MGWPREPTEWDVEYRSGRWDYLDGPSERSHYMIVLGYVLAQKQAPAVLDVGCGHGMLFDLLQKFPLAAYHGIDISKEAISQARFRAAASEPVLSPDFSPGDFESFTPARRYDVIVFNESLSYAVDPLSVLEHFSRWLEPDGVVVVSLCYNWWQDPIWKRIATRFFTLHEAQVTNEERMTWVIRVLAQHEREHDRSVRPALLGRFQGDWRQRVVEQNVVIATNVSAALAVLGSLLRIRK